MFALIFLSSVQSLSRVRLFATPWVTARQASLSLTISQSLPKFMFVASVMPSSHLIPLCFAVVQPLSCVRLFVTSWTAARQASLSLTISQSLPKFMSIALVMPSSYLILWCPLLLLPSIFPSIRVFSNELAVQIRWPKYWSFSFSISLSNEYSGLISFRIDRFDLLLSKGLSRVFSSTTVRKHQLFGAQPSLWSTLTSEHDYWKNQCFR